MPTFEYPLSAPTVSGNNITVDLMLNQPTRITRYLSDLAARVTGPTRCSPRWGRVRWRGPVHPVDSATTCSSRLRGMCRTLSRVLSSRWSRSTDPRRW
jgi:hypothetical protein